MAEATADKVHADAATATAEELSGATAVEALVEDGQDEGEPIVKFFAPFFAKLQLAYFRYTENTTDTVLMVEYGAQQVALSIPGIRKELNLTENDADWKMLDLVVKG